MLQDFPFHPIEPRDHYEASDPENDGQPAPGSDLPSTNTPALAAEAEAETSTDGAAAKADVPGAKYGSGKGTARKLRGAPGKPSGSDSNSDSEFVESPGDSEEATMDEDAEDSEESLPVRRVRTSRSRVKKGRVAKGRVAKPGPSKRRGKNKENEGGQSEVTSFLQTGARRQPYVGKPPRVKPTMFAQAGDVTPENVVGRRLRPRR